MATVVALSLPMLTTKSAFTQDWPNHLWYLWQQSLNIRTDSMPGLFLNADHGLFYPFYGFYGGSLYSLGGFLSLILGEAPVKAYVLTWMLGLAASLGGIYWLARMANVGKYLALMPAIIFVTSAYTLTLIYARGAWPEFMATSSIPLFVASSIFLLRTKALALGPALLLSISTIVLTGSHNITLLWGGTFIALLCVGTLIFSRYARRTVTLAGTGRWLLIVLPSVALNAWFLLPAVAYSGRTRISTYDTERYLAVTSFVTRSAKLFTLSRGTSVNASPGIEYAPDFSLALPILAIGWGLAATVLSIVRRRSRRDPWVPIAAICSVLGAILVVLLTHWTFIGGLPKAYRLVQFPYRLETYVLLTTVGVLIAGLALTKSKLPAPRLWHVALALVTLSSLVGGLMQVSASPNSFPNRDAIFDAAHQPPATLSDPGDYADASTPTVSTVGLPEAQFAQSEVHHERLRATIAVPPGQELVVTNVLGAPYFVQFNGASVLGHTAQGAMVLRLPSRHPRLIVISAVRAHTAPIEIGRVVSLASSLVLFVLLSIGIGRALRKLLRGHRGRDAGPKRVLPA